MVREAVASAVPVERKTPARANAAVAWWDGDDERDHTRAQRNHDSESALSQMLQSFVMKAPSETARITLEPILAAVDQHPDKAHWFIQGLITAEDRQPNS